MNSARDIIHKEEKEAKRRNTEDQLTNVQMDRCTDEGSTNDSLVKRTNDTIGRRSQASMPSHVQSRKDIEIDQYLFELISQGLVSIKFKAWHCRAIYTIGLERYNAVVLDVREAVLRGKEGSGRRIDNPAALLSYKMKGTLQYHAKQAYYRES